MNKITLYYTLVILIFTDIVTTLIAVLYLDATEINPLCDNFYKFMMCKVLVSCFGLWGLWMLRDILYWKYSIALLIILYSVVIITNFYGAIFYYYL